MIKTILILSLVAIALAGNIPWEAGKAQLLQPEGEVIPGSYIVVYKKGISTELAAEHTNELRPFYQMQHEYGFGNFHGFSAKMTRGQVEALRLDTMVQYISHDEVVRSNMPCVSDNQPLSGLWGLCRVGSRNANFGTTENYNSNAGSGTTVFILDTGIYPDHEDYDGRMTFGNNFSTSPDGDRNGHGTHCTGTAVGTKYGVAKGADVVDVKVLGDGGSGSITGVIEGIEYVALRSDARRVGSMSLGAGKNQALDDATDGAVNAGAVFVVAAGNSNANACNYSPAASPLAITVGSTTSTNARSSFSNYGTCMELFAPGSSVLSSWYTAPDATNTLSGTSMACPHVAGIAAAVWSENPSYTAAQVKAEVVDIATKDQVTNPGTGSENLVAYSGCTV